MPIVRRYTSLNERRSVINQVLTANRTHSLIHDDFDAGSTTSGTLTFDIVPAPDTTNLLAMKALRTKLKNETITFVELVKLLKSIL